MAEKQVAEVSAGPMLNIYPDSLGGTLTEVTRLLNRPEMQGAFSSLYILPSLYNSDLDRGFSVIDYGLNTEYATQADIEALLSRGIDLKLDFLLNHASVLCVQFQDILKRGEESIYRDFFIDWNRFWEGCGHMTEEGYIQPEADMMEKMFFRKPGLPLLMVRFPDGKSVPYWNTFYQEIHYPVVDALDLMRITSIQYISAEKLASMINEALAKGIKPADIAFGRFDAHRAVVVEYLESNRKYLGQMDLNVRSPLVWAYYKETLKQLAGYGAKIIRLDAFAYAAKAPGARNFLNEPGTWDVLKRLRSMADAQGITLLPEIHASYSEKTHEKVAEAGYLTYDFFLPGLVLDALESGTGVNLCRWAREQLEKHIYTVNMLGCHDGIPLLDLKGILPEERIEKLIEVVVGRGGMVKDLLGQKNVYYQVNATYFSALGEDERKLLLARAIQLFMPGKPQIWYLDLFAGCNDYGAVQRAAAGGHKEINRMNLSREVLEEKLSQSIVQNQLSLLRFRNQCGAFGTEAHLVVEQEASTIIFTWTKEGHRAVLHADLHTLEFEVQWTNPAKDNVYRFVQAHAGC